METKMRWKAGGLDSLRAACRHDWTERPSPTEDVIAQKRIGAPSYVGAYKAPASTMSVVPSVVRPCNLDDYDTYLQAHANVADPP